MSNCHFHKNNLPIPLFPPPISIAQQFHVGNFMLELPPCRHCLSTLTGRWTLSLNIQYPNDSWFFESVTRRRSPLSTAHWACYAPLPHNSRTYDSLQIVPLIRRGYSQDWIVEISCNLPTQTIISKNQPYKLTPRRYFTRVTLLLCISLHQFCWGIAIVLFVHICYHRWWC